MDAGDYAARETPGHSPTILNGSHALIRQKTCNLRFWQNLVSLFP